MHTKETTIYADANDIQHIKDAPGDLSEGKKELSMAKEKSKFSKEEIQRRKGEDEERLKNLKKELRKMRMPDDRLFRKRCTY